MNVSTNTIIKSITAAAYPNSKLLKAFYRYSKQILLYPVGPPFVIANICSKVLKEKIVRITNTKRVVGIRSGQVISLNCCHFVAPSISQLRNK